MDFNGKMSLVPRVTFFALKDIQVRRPFSLHVHIWSFVVVN